MRGESGAEEFLKKCKETFLGKLLANDDKIDQIDDNGETDGTN